jgi:hypothetical protein
MLVLSMLYLGPVLLAVATPASASAETNGISKRHK